MDTLSGGLLPRHRATPPTAGPDCRILAEPPADAPRRPLGRCGPLVRFRFRRARPAPPIDQVRDLTAYLHRHRDDQKDSPFEIVLGGATAGNACLNHKRF
ncbi:hypothetical protein K9S39_39775 [Streptomyces halobius]|uniref:Uncharacterized protein n=1 Tax=Streptomyces halobius TaxID=2879846 RepID=A0ABY4MHI1_9ACTN|nr:hypothetical protein [Streptomyces halobius]UQA97193.1 hypothetical protein K9S39_39775 [Streptomyces halobius]